ncbi:MAG: PKD domain-containing protein [Bacteroidota bacterium]
MKIDNQQNKIYSRIALVLLFVSLGSLLNAQCLITNFTANISACDPANGNYSIDGVVEFNSPPGTGQLIVEDCNGNQQTFNAPFTSPTNYNLTGLNADGANCNITVYFSDDPGCTQSLSYTAPDCPCNFTFIDVNISACDPNNNEFEISGSVEFDSPPATGQLIIEDCNGNQQTFNAPFSSPQNYNLTGIDSDGFTGCDVTAYFTDDATCTITSNTFDYPDPCECTADAGTYSSNVNGNTTTTNPFLLCFGDQLDITGNGDFQPSDDFNIGGVTYDPGVFLFAYSCPPTVFPPDDINTDPCLAGIASFQNQNWSLTNNIGDNSTLYLVPVTMYSMTDTIYAISINGGDFCYDMGEVFEVSLLEEITTTITEDCQAGEATITINGGQPSFDGSNFTISNLQPASANLSTTTVPNGGTVTITGLTDGDNYSFDIVDDAGCPETISGTFTGTEDASFDYPATTYCQDETDPIANITGDPGGTFTVNPAGLTVDANTGAIDLSSATGTYTITYTTPDPTCFDQSTFDVTINPVPNFTLTGTDPSSCGSNDGTITISGLQANVNYNIAYTENGTPVGPLNLTSDGAGEITLTGLSPGTFANFIVSLNGCDGTNNTSLTLVEPNAPSVDAGPDQTVCEGENVTLTAANPDGANITWDNGVGDGTPFTPSVGTTTYTVTAELSGCTATDQVDVTAHPLPDVEAGNDLTICEGESAVLSGSGANTYTWDNGVTDGVSFIPASTTTYTVTGTSIEGCTDTDQVTIEVVPLPTVDFQGQNLEGCAPVTATFSNTSAGPDVSCVWNFGDGNTSSGCTDVTNTYDTPGCYDVSLEVTDANGCSSSLTFDDYVCADGYPDASFSFSPETLTNIDTEVEFTNTSVGAQNFEWDFGDNQSSTNINPVHIYPNAADEYEVELVAINNDGCADTAYAVITIREELIFYVPNTFTPDKDDFNEVFQPVFTSGFDPFDFKLLIFNRWGEVIFESNDAEVGWDGTYGKSSQRIVKDGTYVWKIIYKTEGIDERQTVVGHVNVLK